MLSIFHFVSNPCGHHDFLLHLSLNIGRLKEIHWYNDDLHHTSFISMSLFSIFIEIHFSTILAGVCVFGRRRRWFPPPPPRVLIPGPWISFSGSNLMRPF